MDREQVKDLIETLIKAGAEVAKLTPTEIDDRVAAVVQAVFGVLWPMFGSNGQSVMLTDEEAALVTEVAYLSLIHI